MVPFLCCQSNLPAHDTLFSKADKKAQIISIKSFSPRFPNKTRFKTLIKKGETVLTILITGMFQLALIWYVTSDTGPNDREGTQGPY